MTTKEVKKVMTSRRHFRHSQLKDPKPFEGLIELEAYGVNLWGDGLRPVLLLRSKNKKEGEDAVTLPVPLNPVEAGVTLSQSNRNNKPVAIHKTTQLLLNSLDLSITACVFEEVRNQKQYVRLHFRNHPKKDSMVLLAEDAMSLCLYLEVPLFASLEFIQKSRTLLAELEGMVEGLKVNPEMLKRNHTYIQ